MALPLALVIMLFGGVLVAVAMYVVVNMRSTTEESVTHMELYNAAQNGVEKAMSLLWENRENLKQDALTYDGDIRSIYAQLDNGSRIDPIEFDAESGIHVTVEILDCNYVLGSGQSFSDELPPQWPGGSGEGGAGGYLGPPSGTSVIIDPSRLFSFGGGSGGRRMVIRSRAEKEGVAATIYYHNIIIIPFVFFRHYKKRHTQRCA